MIVQLNWDLAKADAVEFNLLAGADLVTEVYPEAIALAVKENKNIRFKFNDVYLLLKPTSTVDELYWQYLYKAADRGT